MEDPTTPTPLNPVPPTEPVDATLSTEASNDVPSPVISSEDPANTAKDNLKSIVSTIILLLLAPLLAWLLVTFVFQSYEVDGPSMQTTLQNHDRLILLKLPRTWARITHHPYLPHRGDIIIFTRTDDSGLGESSRQLIKRVIALPGERVVVKDGQLTVFNHAHPMGFSPDKTMSYGSVIQETSGDVDLTVPVGQIFVCGDNRGNSLDSRYFGTVPLNDVSGKLGLRVYPFNKAERF